MKRIAFVASSLILVAACGSGAARSSSSSRTIETTTPTTQLSTRLVDVDGIPIIKLARIARGTAAGYSELHPFDMRVAIGSDRAANALMGTADDTYNFGSTKRAYVIALTGHFECRKCGVPEMYIPPNLAPSTSITTTPTVIPLSTILLVVNPKTLWSNGIRIVDHRVDLAKLGKTYSLGA